MNDGRNDSSVAGAPARVQEDYLTLYDQYFTAPAQDDQSPFSQVSLFTDVGPLYLTDSTEEKPEGQFA
jgi:hypothetical protein